MMKQIDEHNIDLVIEELDTIDENYAQMMSDFEEQQPVVFGFLDKENLSILSDDEREYLEYMALVIFRTVVKAHKKVPMLSEDQIGEAEEKNWEMLETVKGNDFSERLNVFFDDYPQEDLLAFVEDSLVEDPDDPEANMEFVTDEGREPMFVALKSIIDAFHKAL
jgi:hypothetical protein